MVWPKDSFSASWADSSMLYAVGYKHDDRMHLYVMDLADYSTSNINVRVNDTILNTLHSNTDEYGFDVDLEQDVSIELMRWCEGSEDMLLSFMAIDTSGRTHTGYCLYKYRSNETSLIYVS